MLERILVKSAVSGTLSQSVPEIIRFVTGVRVALSKEMSYFS